LNKVSNTGNLRPSALEEDSIESADAAARLAVSAGASGDLDEALRQWGRAVELEPGVPSWWAQFGRIQMRAGHDEAALESYLTADRLKPDVTAWRIAIDELRSRVTQAPPGDRSLELSAAYYDAVFKIKEAYRISHEASVYLPVWERIVALLRARGTRSIVDLGCGPGQLAEFLLGHLRVRYVGFDFSCEAIELAQSRGLEATFKRSNIVGWRKPLTGRFDTVIATEFLEHVEDDLGVLERLPADAYLVASVPNFDSFGHVRYFHSADQVRERYAPLVKEIVVETIDLSEKSAIHVFFGLLVGSEGEQ